MPEACERGLSSHGPGHVGHEMAEIVVIEDVREFRRGDADFLGAGAHGELVAEIADGGEAHAGDAHVLAERRDIFHVEFVERDDAVDVLHARHVADGVDQMLEGDVLGHVEKFVDGFARPVAVAEFFYGEQQDAPAHLFAGAEELRALLVGADAQDGLLAVRHRTDKMPQGFAEVKGRSKCWRL